MAWIEPVTLEGRYVRLEPATLARLDDAGRAADHQEIWRFFHFTMLLGDPSGVDGGEGTAHESAEPLTPARAAAGCIDRLPQL